MKIGTFLGRSSDFARRLALPLVALAALGTALGAAAPAATAAELEKVAVRLDWLPGAYHAPLFLAKERGFYEKHGLDVEINGGQGSISTLQVVSAGNGTIGLANLSALSLAASKGAPVVAIAGIIQRAPEAVIALESSGIRTPKDLEGKRWGAVAGDEAQRLFTGFAATNNIDMSKIRKVTLNHSAAITSLLNGDVDFICAWALQDGLKIARVKPIAPPMLFAEQGLNTLGTSMFVTKSTLAAKPDLLRRFVAATAEGAAAAVADPNAAVDAVLKARPEADRSVLVEEMAALPAYTHTKSSEGKPFGWIAPADLEEMLGLMRKYYQLPPAVTATQIYDGRFTDVAAK
jgi:NitT/TauT family transport system substrate-binding protein